MPRARGAMFHQQEGQQQSGEGEEVRWIDHNGHLRAADRDRGQELDGVDGEAVGRRVRVGADAPSLDDRHAEGEKDGVTCGAMREPRHT